MQPRRSTIPKALYAAMTLQFTVGGSILPFVTIFLRDRGLDFQSIGIIFGAASSTLLVFPFLWGMIADRLMPIHRLFTLLNLAACGALGFLATRSSFGGILMGFLLYYAFYHPTFTLINALSFHYLERPAEQFGSLRAWGSFGWILPSGVIYGWLALSGDKDLSFTPYLGMVFAFLMAIATLLLPPIQPGPRTERLRSQQPVYWRLLGGLLRDRNYLILLVAFFLVAGSFSLLVYYSPQHLEARGVPRAWIGLVQSFGIAVEILLFPFLRRFIARWGYTMSLFLGSACLAVRHVLFAVVEGPLLLSLSYGLAGMVIVFFHIGASILVNAMAAREVRATAQTLLVLVGSGLGPMCANPVAGWLADRNGNDLRPAFWFAAGLAGLASVLIALRGAKLNRISSEA